MLGGMTDRPDPDVYDPGLYIVATPIGNLGDISQRAVQVLRGVAAVACEDTRITGKLLHHMGISQKLIRYDDHASDSQREALLAMAENRPVALVSDAGTPLIADPGFKLVREARRRGIAVRGIPGANAALLALVMSGLPTDRFLFAGFMPPKDTARRRVLEELGAVKATLVFYETGPRLVATLESIAGALPDRDLAVARELTKMFEECRTGSASDLADHYRTHPPKGEIVVLIGPPGEADAERFDVDALLRAALAEAKPSQAAAEVARRTGLDRKALYARALELR